MDQVGVGVVALDHGSFEEDVVSRGAVGEPVKGGYEVRNSSVNPWIRRTIGGTSRHGFTYRWK